MSTFFLSSSVFFRKKIMINIKRICRHVFHACWQGLREFPHSSLVAIENEIHSCEYPYHGEIRFVVESALPIQLLLENQSARKRATNIFSQLKMSDEHVNVVLVYVLLADCSVEIVVNFSIHETTEKNHWEIIRSNLKTEIHAGNCERGVIDAIKNVYRILKKYFPETDANNYVLLDSVMTLVPSQSL